LSLSESLAVTLLTLSISRSNFLAAQSNESPVINYYMSVTVLLRKSVSLTRRRCTQGGHLLVRRGIVSFPILWIDVVLGSAHDWVVMFVAVGICWSVGVSPYVESSSS
jgi:hypothetical protein